MTKREMVETERIRQDGYWLIWCAECNLRFDSRRMDAAYCSSTCKTRAHRKKEEMEKTISRARDILNDLIDLTPDVGDSAGFQALLDIQKRILKKLEWIEME